MLTFVGLGLYDEHSITLEGRDALQAADQVMAEFYTSRLAGTTIPAIEAAHDITIDIQDRTTIEQTPDDILEAANTSDVAFVTAGDPMISTTHVALRLQAATRGITTRVIHGTTAQTAAASLTGLQNYRFGKATTLPFPDTHPTNLPDSVLNTITTNQTQGLHTLIYLDLTPTPTHGGANGLGEDDAAQSSLDSAHEGLDGLSYLTGDRAAGILADELDTVGVVVARAGSPDPVVTADHLSSLAETTFGDPLHLLVIPGDLHVVEHEALTTFADAPPDSLPDPI